MRYKLVCFDFDHTLTIGTTAAEHAADLLGRRADIAEAERAFRAGELTTWQFTDLMAMQFCGWTPEEIARHMRSIPLVDEIGETVRWLKGQGLRVAINTVGFRDLILPFGETFGFDAVSGVRLDLADGHFTGRVTAYFPLEDKIGFARDEVATVGAQLDAVIAIGDGLSDVPLFRSVGRAVAFNAAPAVEAQTHAAVRSGSCAALRPIFESYLNEQEGCA